MINGEEKHLQVITESQFRHYKEHPEHRVP